MMDWNYMAEEEHLDMVSSGVFGKDRLALSLVSRHWNAVTKKSPYSHSPCLIFPYGKSTNNFLKIFQHDSYFHIDLPRAIERNALTRCTKYGWSLMSRDDGTLFFIDPFNNQKIQVPETPNIRRGRYTTISFFHPPTSPDCFIVGVFQPRRTHSTVFVDILRHGQDKWEMYACVNLYNHFELSLAPPMLRGDDLYFLGLKGNIGVFHVTDEHPGEVVEDLPEMWPYAWNIFPRCHEPPELRRNIREHFWVKDKDEDAIFAVFVMNEDRKVRVFKLLDVYPDNFCWKRMFYVYRKFPKLRWEPVEDLGDKVFYVSISSSFSYTTPIKSMANKIFFPKFHDDKVVYYSLETNKYHTFGDDDYSSDYPYGFKSFDFATWTLPAPAPQLPGQALSWCPKEEDVVIT